MLELCETAATTVMVTRAHTVAKVVVVAQFFTIWPFFGENLRLASWET